MYALTFLPPLLTAPLAGLADRYSRRAVLVTTDLLRAALVGTMAVPALPLPVVAGLLVAATCPQPLFSAARYATRPAMLPGGRGRGAGHGGTVGRGWRSPAGWPS